MRTITEFLQKKQGDGRFSYHPKTKEELQDIIVDLCNQGIYNLNCIDTSAINNMEKLFDMENGIGEKIDMSKIDISRWNVSNVENMRWMFYKCKSFNCDLSRWDVSNVEGMLGMFYWCESFNQDISNWDVANAKYMRGMFNSCIEFDCDLSRWNVSNVTDMGWMFNGCKSFNCDLNNWNVADGTDISCMFEKCSAPKPKWYKD